MSVTLTVDPKPRSSKAFLIILVALFLIWSTLKRESLARVNFNLVVSANDTAAVSSDLTTPNVQAT